MRTMVKLAADASQPKWWRDATVYDENGVVWNVARKLEVPPGGPRAVEVRSWFVTYMDAEQVFVKGMWDGYTILIDEATSAATYFVMTKRRWRKR